MDLLGPQCSETQRQHAAGGDAADDDRIALLGQFVVRLLECRIPVAPARKAGDVGAAGEAGEQRAVNGVAKLGQRMSDELQLDGRAAEAMNKQDAVAPTGNEDATPSCLHFLAIFHFRN